MTSRSKPRTWALVGLCLLTMGAIAQAAEDATPHGPVGGPTAREILDRAYRNLYAEDYVQELELVTVGRGGQEMSRSLQITRRQSQQPGKALVRFTAPQQIRKTSVLILESDEHSDELFVYLPALQKSKRLSASQRADAFFGTDLSYEDVEPKRTRDYAVERVGEDAYRGIPCVLIEQRAQPPFVSTYERMVSCVEVERGVILWTDYFRGGKKVKRLEVDPTSVRMVADRYIPHLITIETPARGSRTRVLTESYELRDDIPDSLFTTYHLEKGDAGRDRVKAGAPRETSQSSPD